MNLRMPGQRSRPRLPARQRGMATLYVVLAVGLGVSITVAASIYTLRGNQQRQITTHSVTAAQAAAWRGAETVRRYLLEVGQPTMAQWASSSGTALSLPATISGMSALGIPDGNARITSISGSGNDYRIGVAITALAGSGSATTSATVEVVYEVSAGGSSGGGGGTPTCAVIPSSPMRFNGDLLISGGSLSVTNASSMQQIAVSGRIDVSGGSATISGCAKGDITLTGGGVAQGGQLYSEGTISIRNVSPPNNTDIWGRNITLPQDGGSYRGIKAGGFTANVFSGSTQLGTTVVGGRLLANTVSGGVPWRVGTVLPTNAGKITVRVTNGDDFLLDLSRVTINTSTGTMSGASTAENLTKRSTATLPDSLQFRATDIAGGTISLASTSSTVLWGHAVTTTGWGGTYPTLYANGALDVITPNITTLIAGADVTATQAGLYWNMPTIGTGTVAGKLRYGSSRQVVPDPSQVSRNLRVDVAGTTPGLPGVPYCEARLNRLDVSTYRDAANYIFEWVNNAPQLTVRNVKNASGASIDGVYNLATQDVRTLPSGGAPFLVCNWQAANNGNAHCFRNKTASNAWSISGLTRFPRGVAWFDNAVTIDGLGLNDDDGNRELISSLIAKGNVTLTNGGSNLILTAPNRSTPARVCQGAYRPTNLCDSTSSTPQFAEWVDTDGTRRRGIPTANMALVTEGTGTFAGWEMKGNVILGGAMGTSGARATVRGSLTVGTNTTSPTTVTAGGADVIVPDSTDQQYTPGICTTPTTPPVSSTPSAVIRWSRYL